MCAVCGIIPFPTVTEASYQDVGGYRFWIIGAGKDHLSLRFWSSGRITVRWYLNHLEDVIDSVVTPPLTEILQALEPLLCELEEARDFAFDLLRRSRFTTATAGG